MQDASFSPWQENVRRAEYEANSGVHQRPVCAGAESSGSLSGPTVEPDLPRPESMADVVGESRVLQDVYRAVDRVANLDSTVLITGESGTGKELVARALHGCSRRAKGRFTTVNCAAIPENLLESELFGHARGAFTGAHAAKTGKIAQAQGGTLFLDEIGELPLALQVKLLRVLQTREYSPVGDNRTLKTDARIVAATNVDLESAVAKGQFREDLYYRLDVINLVVPPLRERPTDVILLAQRFFERARDKTGRTDVQRLSRSGMHLLEGYGWPGNVRELENTIERAVALCAGPDVQPNDLPPRVHGLGPERRPPTTLPDAGINLRKAVETFENELIRQALQRTKWNKNRAAMLLGLNRTTLVEMLKRKRIQQAA